MLHQSLLWHLLSNGALNTTSASNQTLDYVDPDWVNNTLTNSINEWTTSSNRRQSLRPNGLSTKRTSDEATPLNVTLYEQTEYYWYNEWYIHTLWVIIALLLGLAILAVIVIIFMYHRAKTNLTRNSPTLRPAIRSRANSSVWDNISFYTIDNPNVNSCPGRPSWDAISADDSYLASLDQAISTGFAIQYYANQRNSQSVNRQSVNTTGSTGQSVIVNQSSDSNGVVVRNVTPDIRDSSVYSVLSNQTQTTDVS